MKTVFLTFVGVLASPLVLIGTAQALPSPVARAVPEFSASGAGPAMFLIAGGLLVLAGRRKKSS